MSIIFWICNLGSSLFLGSWLEIGQSISFFCITSLLLVWSAGICVLGEWLMRDVDTEMRRYVKDKKKPWNNTGYIFQSLFLFELKIQFYFWGDGWLYSREIASFPPSEGQNPCAHMKLDWKTQRCRDDTSYELPYVVILTPSIIRLGAFAHYQSIPWKHMEKAPHRAYWRSPVRRSKSWMQLKWSVLDAFESHYAGRKFSSSGIMLMLELTTRSQ